MQSAIDRIMQAYGMMLNLTPEQEAVEGLKFLRGPDHQACRVKGQQISATNFGCV
jgi:hypothetical protein